jgi:hypothetical protein
MIDQRTANILQPVQNAKGLPNMVSSLKFMIFQGITSINLSEPDFGPAEIRRHEPKNVEQSGVRFKKLKGNERSCREGVVRLGSYASWWGLKT